MADATISATAPRYELSNLNEQSRLPVTTLDQDDFLKLLVTQMTTQDPLKPMEDLSSFSQLASFSALEQNKATQASMAMIQANSMLGHFVQVADDLGQSMVGQVDQVLMINGEPQLVVDGERFTLDKVSAISAQPFNVDDAGESGGPPSTDATRPDASPAPRLGPAPRLEVDPILGLVPGLIESPRTGEAPVLNDDARLGAVSRF